MEWKAQRESLSFALGVNDYRDFLGVSRASTPRNLAASQVDEDDKLLLMHS